MIQIIHDISLHFFKLYISKICNGIYIYIYIWFRIELGLDSSIFAPNNSLTIKIKNLDRHMVENQTPIEIQFRI